MEEWEFYAAFSRNHCTRPLFRGTFARDEIAREKSEPGLYVVNTAPRSSRGEHWCLMFVPSTIINNKGNNNILYFDSYGLKPLYKEYYQFIHPRSTFYYNSKRLQGYGTATCGLYCLYVGALLSCGFSLQECTKRFSSTNFSHNDRLIPTLVRKEFPTDRSGMSCCSLSGKK